jgi:hypothetical protein
MRPEDVTLLQQVQFLFLKVVHKIVEQLVSATVL